MHMKPAIWSPSYKYINNRPPTQAYRHSTAIEGMVQEAKLILCAMSNYILYIDYDVPNGHISSSNKIARNFNVYVKSDSGGTRPAVLGAILTTSPPSPLPSFSPFFPLLSSSLPFSLPPSPSFPFFPPLPISSQEGGGGSGERCKLGPQKHF